MACGVELSCYVFTRHSICCPIAAVLSALAPTSAAKRSMAALGTPQPIFPQPPSRSSLTATTSLSFSSFLPSRERTCRAKCALITQPYYNANRYSPPRKLCRNSLFMPLRALSVADWTTINIKFACTKIQQRTTNAAEVSAG